MCIVTTLNQGLRNGGGIGDILRAPSSKMAASLSSLRLTVTVTPVPSNTTHTVATPEQSALSHPITVDSNNPFIRWTSFISLLNSKSSARRSLSDFLEDGSDTSDTDSSEDWDGESQPLEKHHNNQDANEEFEFLQVNEPTIQIVSPNKDEDYNVLDTSAAEPLGDALTSVPQNFPLLWASGTAVFIAMILFLVLGLSGEGDGLDSLDVNAILGNAPSTSRNSSDANTASLKSTTTEAFNRSIIQRNANSIRSNKSVGNITLSEKECEVGEVKEEDCEVTVGKDKGSTSSSTTFLSPRNLETTEL
ncbi:hypothetical protein DAPPUDRAFT_234055 [Daphnia pulex]|uniref:Uncharacterized protein n=1 Tax=Daphnia pulex TaxID=6669 RepID=E9FUG4_DAPPU|nr:hypothetical protein DAPPUDRAFT_234055 [Daphnia pulex]|eukprot:EFX88927.1 hypothetical protein DAPPUDRAFT_234055 [Daphnia pulex]